MFRNRVIVLLAVYQSFPIYYLFELFGQREGLNPKTKPGFRHETNLEDVVSEREEVRCDCLLRFLWIDYRPAWYYFEVIDM